MDKGPESPARCQGRPGRRPYLLPDLSRSRHTPCDTRYPTRGSHDKVKDARVVACAVGHGASGTETVRARAWPAWRAKPKPPCLRLSRKVFMMSIAAASRRETGDKLALAALGSPPAHHHQGLHPSFIIIIITLIATASGEVILYSSHLRGRFSLQAHDHGRVRRIQEDGPNGLVRDHLRDEGPPSPVKVLCVARHSKETQREGMGSEVPWSRGS